jgi:hypothetical protein
MDRLKIGSYFSIYEINKTDHIEFRILNFLIRNELFQSVKYLYYDLATLILHGKYTINYFKISDN